ncbi:MAG TPA: hypothetical protein VMS18_24845 [Candidatus Binatia bacterium]|nr:hypothetical protein [Candidatus Binatia bacterium]
MGPPNQVADFLRKLHDDPITQNVVGTFDTLLGALTGSGPVIGPIVYPNPVAQMMKQVMEREKVLSEIDRQLILQFLEGEITYFKTHRTLKVLALYHRVHHDQQVCQKKQVQIRAALNRLFDVQQIDSGLYAALAQERGNSIVGYVKMKISDDYGWTPTIDDYLDAHEAIAVRKIMEQVVETWMANNDDLFAAPAEWADLKERLDAWASKHHKRVGALKGYWTASGGGKDIDSNDSGLQIIKAYYKDLYATIEEGDLARFIKKAAGLEP